MIQNRPKPNTGMCSRCPNEWQSKECKEFHRGTYAMETIIIVLLVLFISYCLVNSNLKKPSCSPLGSEKYEIEL
jgi:hypothetical protein